MPLLSCRRRRRRRSLTPPNPHFCPRPDAFDNIARLTFRRLDGETGDRPGDAEATEELFTRTAVGMHSKDGGEHVDFCGDFECEGPVEEWLNGLVTMMRDTLKNILGKAKFAADHWEIEKPRREWLFDYPAQIALTASQIIWTEEVDATFDAFEDGNEQAMKEYLKTVLARLESLIQLVLGKLNKRDRTKIITLITVDVHNRDVVQKLIDGRVQSSAAFAWQSQMRYEWRAEEQSCLVKVADATFDYSYEYVGNTGRLVITPLTDRCYITLTQALRLIMGGAPAGPAGTGKTETTKDLGRALGLPVYVFNWYVATAAMTTTATTARTPARTHARPHVRPPARTPARTPANLTPSQIARSR